MISGCTLLLLSACGTDEPNKNTSTTTQQSTTNETTANNNTDQKSTAGTDTNIDRTANTIDITKPTISMTEAVNVFKEAHPDAKIESIELDADSGRLHYDIDGFDSSKEYETEIDATTKEIKDKEVDIERNRDESLDFSAIIDPAKAIEIASATKEAEGLSPTGWKLEADDSKQTYTIEYDNNGIDIDIKIDAVTEEILEVDND